VQKGNNVKHPDDMTEDELRELVKDMSWEALNIAQDLMFTNELLKPKLKAAEYVRICNQAYALCNMPYNSVSVLQPSVNEVKPNE
jgi:hypothetical protein